MRSIPWSRIWLLAGCFAVLAISSANAQTSTLVLPFRTVGVSDTTATVSRDLLVGDLEGRGFVIIARDLPVSVPTGPQACDEAACAEAVAREVQASQVIYGSLSKLGDKIIVRARVLRVGEAAPYYSDQITAVTEEDLDTVMRRIAEGIAAGRPNSEAASIESITREEAQKPRRRAGRSGIGFRAGAIFPDGDSYGGDQLTSLRLLYKFEGDKFLIESTPVLGIAWGDGTVEWTVLDVFAARIFGTGDVSGYVGGGLGMRSLHVERDKTCFYDCGQGSECPYACEDIQSATTLSADIGGGVILFRTYNYQIVVDLKYHYVFNDFDQIGGKGAHGLMLTFGSGR